MDQIFASKFSSPRRTLVVSTPGGLACQYRVQHRTPAGDWHCDGSFHNRMAAHACLVDLQSRGFEARLLAVRICPSAA